jgi:exodeoxyribonuclease-3
MKIISWNVNGLRACERNGFTNWFESASPDVLCLQEVRAELPQLPEHHQRPVGYHALYNPAFKKGYSGVSTWSATSPSQHALGLAHTEFDSEGRVIVTEYADFALYNIYFPNGSRDHSRVPFKLAFYEHLMGQLAARLAKGDRLVIGGDFNTAHQEIDLANPRANATTTGFLPEERAILQRFLDLGFMDVFRERHPGEKGHYSWWSNRPGVRERNIGWRIDYFLVSANLLEAVKDARYLPEVLGSDHCPVLLELA